MKNRKEEKPNRNNKFRVAMTTALALMLVFATAATPANASATGASVMPVSATAPDTMAAVTEAEIDRAITETAAYMVKAVPNPSVSSIGGEWAVFSLARSEASVPAGYYNNYYSAVEKAVKDSGGVLHERKYTEYSRVVLALTAIGRDVTNVGGYNLLEKLADFERTSWQGVNGSIWALIALDSHDYEIPQVSGVKTQATRDLYIENILSKEIITADGTRGGFALAGTEPDADTTAMALIALASYQDRPDVKAATDRALAALSALQLDNGGFATAGDETSESLSQTIIALSALKIDQSADSRFIKNGNRTLPALMEYYISGGGFAHVPGEGLNQMGTEQGMDAIAAYSRYLKNKTALFDMSDVVIDVGMESGESAGDTSKEIKVLLNGKPIAFDQAPIIENGRTLVPMRAIFEALGAEVEWNNATRTVTGALGDKEIKLTIGNTTAYVNEEARILDVPAKIENGRTLVPARFISESLEASVSWDGATKTVSIIK